MIFEIVLFLREIDPKMELAWTKWIEEEEYNYNEIFLAESVSPDGCLFCTSRDFNNKWAEFTRNN